jgi:hypothetical protein
MLLESIGGIVILISHTTTSLACILDETVENNRIRGEIAHSKV